MTPEEFEKIKEAEKEHLRKMRQLKTAVRELERQKKISGAIADMTSSIEDKLDVHDEMINRVAVDAALNEARLEIALERTEEKDQRDQLLEDEAALAKAQAKEVVNRIREGQLHSSNPADTTKSVGKMASRKTPDEALESDKSEPTVDQKDDLPEKTIGRMKP